MQLEKPLPAALASTDHPITRTTACLHREPCEHRRMIDDVRDKNGRRTGHVRCLECQAVFDDPYTGKR